MKSIAKISLKHVSETNPTESLTINRYEFRVLGIDGYIKYSIYHVDDVSVFKTFRNFNAESVVRDSFGYINDITYIDYIIIEGDRGKGDGSKLLRTFINEHIDEFIVLNAAAINEDDYYNRLDEVLDDLTKFYTKNGFININNRVGFYEESIAFGYDNHILRKSLGLEIEEVKKF